MNDEEARIRDTLITTAIEDWLRRDEPFSDVVYEDGLLEEVTERLGEEVERNDVEYVWKLLTEDGYFRKRGKSRRITAREIDEAEDLGVETPMDPDVQEEILRVLAEAERENVNQPKLSRADLSDRLEYEDDVIDYNLFYCRSKGWADVEVYLSSAPWASAGITRFGRNMVKA